MKKKICVFTGTRADYGLLYWLMKDINASDHLDLQLIVSGSHLSEFHGSTYKLIESDGFSIDYKLDLGLTNKDSRLDVAITTGKSTSGVAKALDSLKPDVLVVLGDRYELLGAATAALLLNVPIFHLHGGEVTEGAYDDSIRHAITKMATWHGVAAEPYRDRVIQMGEYPDNVFNVGAMGLDNIAKLPLMKKKELEESIDFRFGQKNFLITYHPETHAQPPDEGFDCLLEVITRFPDIRLIFTSPNADSGRSSIAKKIEEFVGLHPQRAKAFVSLGQLRYLSLFQYVDAVVGNSSSGIIEAPAFSIGTINIGNRQKGRLRANSIIDAESNKQSIEASIVKLFSKEFKKNLKNVSHPYGEPGAAIKVTALLNQLEPSRKVGGKRFYDLS